MFCKIDDKYYVKVSNFFQELEVVNNIIKPKLGEENRIYSPVSNLSKVSSEDVLKALTKKNKKKEIKNLDIF